MGKYNIGGRVNKTSIPKKSGFTSIRLVQRKYYLRSDYPSSNYLTRREVWQERRECGLAGPKTYVRLRLLSGWSLLQSTIISFVLEYLHLLIQFFIRVNDMEVLPYLRCLTLLPLEEIESIYNTHMVSYHLR